jgi:hypothetical protein
MRLSTLYQILSTEEREALARKAGTSAAYLYQLATRWDGRKPSIPLLMKLVQADSRLSLADMAQEFNEAPKVKAA